MPSIRPCLWCTDDAQAMVDHYTSVFSDSRVVETSHYGKDAPLPEGTLLTAVIELNGQELMLLNGGEHPNATRNDAFSLAVTVETQDEVDTLWERLGDGGTPGPCGWLKDRFGVSWQIVPKTLLELLSDNDRDRAARVMHAMMAMGKIDIATLQRAHAGEEQRA